MADDKKADDVQDTKDDEVLAALQDDEQESPKAEPSPAKEEKPEEVKETKEEAQAEPAESTEAEKKEEEAPAETTEEPAEDKPGKAEERKAQLNTEIRDLVAKRNALKEEVTKANEVYQPATEDELVEQGLSATDAKVEALRQRIEVKDYNDKVVDAQLTLSSESERVLNDFPLFNPDSEQFDKELSGEAAALLEANLIYDQNTQQVIGSNVSPYQLYKTIARAHESSVVKGQMQGQANTEEMLANADSAGSASPAKKAKDPILDILASDDY